MWTMRGGDYGGAGRGRRRAWRVATMMAAAGVALVTSVVVPSTRRGVSVGTLPPVPSDMAAAVESLVARVAIWTGEGRRWVVVPPPAWAQSGRPVSVRLAVGGSLDLAVERRADGVVSVCVQPAARLPTTRVEVVLRRALDEHVFGPSVSTSAEADRVVDSLS
jgi:hypothetical protein